MSEQQKEKSIKAKIIDLLKKGYTRSQLINDLDFAERTVDAAIKEYKQSGGDVAGDRAIKSENKATAEMLPAKTKTGEIIIPEWIAREMVNIFDGGEKEQRLYLAGMAIPILGIRLLQEMVKPLTDLMLSIRKQELEAVMETQTMSGEMADRVAQGVSAQVLEALRQQAAASPMEQLMVDMLRQPLMQLISQIMGVPMGQASGQPQFGYNIGAQVTEKEIKEVFRD